MARTRNASPFPADHKRHLRPRGEGMGHFPLGSTSRKRLSASGAGRCAEFSLTGPLEPTAQPHSVRGRTGMEYKEEVRVGAPTSLPSPWTASRLLLMQPHSLPVGLQCLLPLQRPLPMRRPLPLLCPRPRRRRGRLLGGNQGGPTTSQPRPWRLAYPPWRPTRLRPTRVMR